MIFSLHNNGLYDQDTFYEKFMKDVAYARQRVIIESPFITTKRVYQLLPILKKLINQGVMVVVNTKPYEEHDLAMGEMAHEGISALQEIGVRVLMTVGHHRKIAVIDNDVLWEGSLNILSQGDSCEIMRRIQSEEITEQTLKYLRLDRFYNIK